LNHDRDWRVFGIEVAVSLALDAVLEDRRDLVWKSFIKREVHGNDGAKN